MLKRKDVKGRNLKTGESQRPDGKYEFKYIDAYKVRRSMYSWRLLPSDPIPKGKRECKSLRELEQELELDSEKRLLNGDGKNITLNECFDTYMKIKNNIKPTTRYNYMHLYDFHIREKMGRRRVTDIKPVEVKLFLSDLVKRGMKSNSLKNFSRVLNPAFELAVENNWIAKNPMKKVYADIANDYDPRKGLTEAQTIALLQFIKTSKRYSFYLPFIAIMIGTGLRIGEASGLSWADCDLDNGVIRVEKQIVHCSEPGKGYVAHLAPPKTKSGKRAIPLFDWVKKEFLELREFSKEHPHKYVEIDGCSDFVFFNKHGRLLTKKVANQMLRCIRDDYNAAVKGDDALFIEKLSSHILRHTFCCYLCNNTSNIKAIQTVMGHADIQTTYNIYYTIYEHDVKTVFNEIRERRDLHLN